VAAVRNGLAFCAIHHRAFDQDLVGVSPDYQVRVASTAALIELPRSTASRPDRELLAERFARFSAA
jgi:putative restriction endonuclease